VNHTYTLALHKYVCLFHMLYMILGCFYEEEGAGREPVGGRRRGKIAPYD